MTLATEDFRGVELLAIGGPVKGHGSPPGGEYVTRSNLHRLAEATRELMDAGELRSPVKLGHGRQPSGAPAAGWVENVRLNEDGTRLLGDLRKVPKTIADLVRSGSYRTRSAELARVTSPSTGRRHLALGGLALLGATVPAVKGLADIVKLYSQADVEIVRAFEAPLQLEADEEGLDDAEFARYFEATFGEPASLPPRPRDADEAERFEIARTFGLRPEEVV